MNILIQPMPVGNYPVCYAVVFDTGYFYIGATQNFRQRFIDHKTKIKNKPEDYLIGILHNPKSCIIVKLIISTTKDQVFKHERDLIMLHSSNPKLINKNQGAMMIGYSSKKIKKYIKFLNKYINNDNPRKGKG